MAADAVATLSRAHRLFASPVSSAPADPTAVLTSHADQLVRTHSGGGIPTVAVTRSGMAVDGLRSLGRSEGALAEIITASQRDREQGERGSRVLLDAARADTAPAADTPLGQRELARRMVARLRAQHGIVIRSRAQAHALAMRLRRVLYLRQQRLARAGLAGTAAEGAGPVRDAIGRALTHKGIRDPRARARWLRGMDLVVSRESGYRDVVNGDDSNAGKGTPSAGVFQFIKPTFDSYWQPGTPREWRNSYSQAAAFINYAMGRYGVAADGSNLAARIQQADPTRPPKGY